MRKKQHLARLSLRRAALCAAALCAAAIAAALLFGAFGTPTGTQAAGGPATATPTAGPSPTPKPTDASGVLTGVYDIVVDGGSPTFDAYHCISYIQHRGDNTIKAAAQCFDNLGVLANTNAEPLNDPPGEGPDGLGFGPPPPPPYSPKAPAKGAGMYNPGPDTLLVATCFEELGPPSGPNIIAVLTVGSAAAQLASTGKQTGAVDMYLNQPDSACFALTPIGAPNFAGLGTSIYPAADMAICPVSNCIQSAFRNGGTPDMDWDNDGCTDEAELDKLNGTKCGDDPWNPNDTNLTSTDVAGDYNWLITAVDSDCNPGASGNPSVCELPGDAIAGLYYWCVSNMKQTGKNLTARALCYIDHPAIPINPQASTSCPSGCGDGFPGSPPPGVTTPGGMRNFADIDTKHLVLTGVIDNTKNIITLAGCWEDLDGQSPLGNVYLRLSVDLHTGHGFVELHSFETLSNCQAATPTNLGGDARLDIVRQTTTSVGTRDSDGDGCTDEQEFRDTVLRDPLNSYDFYDTNGDLIIDGADVAYVQSKLFNDDSDSNPGLPPYTAGYDPASDRGGQIPGGNGWNLRPPDGMVRSTDVVLVALLQGSTCTQSVYNPAPPAPSLSLTPQTATNPVGTDHTVTANVSTGSGPASGVSVAFKVRGANIRNASVMTNASGVAQYTYTGDNTGTDTITASATVNSTLVEEDDPAQKTWVGIEHQGNFDAVAGGALSPLDAPQGIARAADGSLYVADTAHCRVLRVVNGVHTIVAGQTNDCGFTDGVLATSGRLDGPTDVAVDSTGNLYIADRNNHRVRKVVTGGDGIVNAGGAETMTTVAGNGFANYATCTSGSSATGPCLSQPTGVWIDSGGVLYIASWGSHRVMAVTGTTITMFAGNGTAGLCADGGAATGACVSGPWDVVGDNSGNTYISSSQNHVVRRVTGGLITTVAGNGTAGACSSGSGATGACLSFPAGIDLSGGDLYVASSGNGLLRRVNSGTIYTQASGLSLPIGVAADGSVGVYASDAGDDSVLLVTPSLDLRTALGRNYCGDTLVAVDSSCLSEPSDTAVDNDGNVYVADPADYRVRRVKASDAHIDTVAGKTSDTNCAVDGQQASQLCLIEPRDIAVSPDNNLLYISDVGTHQVWRVNLTSGVVRSLAGNGTAGLCSDDASSHGACLDQPRGLAVKQSGGGTDQYLYIAEEGNAGRVLRLNLIDETIRTVHSDGNASTDVALGTDDSLYVAQPGAHRVLRVTPGSGIVEGTVFDGSETSSAVAGTGSPGIPPEAGAVATTTDLDAPASVDIDRNDGHLLVSSAAIHRMFVVTTGQGTTTVVDGESSELIFPIAGGGTPTPGYCGDGANARQGCMDSPGGIGYDEVTKALYVADAGNQRVRKIRSDCDADGLTDLLETTLRAHPWKAALGTFVTSPCDSDTDDDGCTDAQEVGSNQNAGGRRRPTDGNDYFNPSHDGVNRVDDILLVVQAYFDDDNDGNPGLPPYALGYNPDTDRTLVGPNAWNLGAPNGLQRVDDILNSVKHYFHDCA